MTFLFMFGLYFLPDEWSTCKYFKVVFSDNWSVFNKMLTEHNITHTMQSVGAY